MIGVDGTEEGGNQRAKAFHVDCIQLRFTGNSGINGDKMIYQII